MEGDDCLEKATDKEMGKAKISWPEHTPEEFSENSVKDRLCTKDQVPFSVQCYIQDGSNPERTIWLNGNKAETPLWITAFALYFLLHV